ncbi:MAG: hypothetical protein ABI640_13035 [Gammaproteobacteria bacterium]
MPSPSITAFGDADHAIGELGLVVDGAGFGPFPGELWIYENEDQTGTADQLVVGDWTDMQLTGVEIPASPTTAMGTRYLFLQRADSAWSFAFPFTLEAAAGVRPGGVLAQLQYPTVTVELPSAELLL